METNDERRLRKLMDVCASKGGHAAVAKAAGLKPAHLDQILKGVLLPKKKDGSRSPRALGDDSARAIEQAYKLERGWFDNDGDAEVTPNELLLLGYFRKLDLEAQRLLIKDLHDVVEQRARLVLSLKRGLAVETEATGVKRVHRKTVK